MESNLNDILARINMKLNNFTQESNPTRDINNHTKNQSFSAHYKNHAHHIPMHDREVASEQEIQRQDYADRYKANRYKAKNILNQEEEIGLHQQYKNKNKNLGYQQFRASRSHQKADNLLTNSNIQKSSIQYHEQALFSLKQRNNALQDDVKNLKNRLKLLQSSLEKDSKQKNQKSKQLIKVKSVNNQMTKQSVRTGYSNKQIRKVPTQNKKSHWTSQTNLKDENKKFYKNSKISSQSQNYLNYNIPKHVNNSLNCKEKLYKKANNTFNQYVKNYNFIRKNQVKSSQGPSFQTSLHNIITSDKTPKGSKIQVIEERNKPNHKSIAKNNQDKQKLLNKSKSAQTLNQLKVESDGVKQDKGRSQKLGLEQSIVSSSASYSYLRPLDPSERMNPNRFIKQNKNTSKVVKGGLKKITKLN